MSPPPRNLVARREVVAMRREFIAMFDRLTDQIEHVRELVRQAEANGDKALLIRTAEIERRLTALNHEYQRAAEERARVVSADTWTQFQASFDEWRTGVNAFRSDLQGRLTILASVYAGIVLVVSIFINYVLRGS